MKKQGILLVNLGSPDAPDTRSVRRYLREFLMDPRVIDIPYPLRFCLVNGCILPVRPRKSAEAYRSIWTAEGSPLVVMGRRVRQLLQSRLPIPVELAMRYQNPSIEDAIGELAYQGVEEAVTVPLFPHYAMSSYETAWERVMTVVQRQAPQMSVEVIPPYYAAGPYIQALVASAQPWLDRGYDHLLFSFHGLPERHLKKSDPTGCHCLAAKNCCEVESPAHATCYRAQCLKTVREFTRRAGISDEKYSIAFQSRLGREPWMTPPTDVELVRLARAGRQRVCVICPAFVSDCLETLEEIAIRGRETFLAAGGRELELIPCLNDHPKWIEALDQLIRPFLHPLGGLDAKSIKALLENRGGEMAKGQSGAAGNPLRFEDGARLVKAGE